MPHTLYSLPYRHLKKPDLNVELWLLGLERMKLRWITKHSDMEEICSHVVHRHGVTIVHNALPYIL